jgi:hypothetical protein
MYALRVYSLFMATKNTTERDMKTETETETGVTIPDEARNVNTVQDAARRRRIRLGPRVRVQWQERKPRTV